MAMNNTLSTALSKIMNAERIGKKECIIEQPSNVIKNTLDLMKENRYIGEYEEIEDGRGGKIKINLLGNINKCGSVTPRFSTKNNEIEKWEKRYLPARGFGVLIISTPEGMITNQEAREKEIGGKLIAYCY